MNTNPAGSVEPAVTRTSLAADGINSALASASDALSMLGIAAPGAQAPQPAAPPAPPVPESAAPAAPASLVPEPAAPASPVPEPAAPARTDPSTLRGRLSGEISPPRAVEAIPEEPPPNPDGVEHSPAQRVTWAKLRTERNHFERQARDAEAQAETAREEARRVAAEKAELDAARETLQAERDDLVERLGRANLAESPKFQQRYDDKIAAVQGKLAKDLETSLGVDAAHAPREAARLLRMTPEEIAEAMSDAPALALARVLRSVEEHATLEQQRTDELAHWRETSASLGVAQAREDAARATAERRRWAEDAMTMARNEGNPAFVASDDASRAYVEQVAREVHGFVQTATQEELTRSAVNGFVLPVVLDELNRVVEENRGLRDALERGRRLGAPPMLPSAPHSPPPPAPAAQPGVTPVPEASRPRDFLEQAATGALDSLRPVFGGPIPQ